LGHTEKILERHEMPIGNELRALRMSYSRPTTPTHQPQQLLLLWYCDNEKKEFLDTRTQLDFVLSFIVILTHTSWLKGLGLPKYSPIFFLFKKGVRRRNSATETGSKGVGSIFLSTTHTHAKVEWDEKREKENENERE
jgi:hypothetical protein